MSHGNDDNTRAPDEGAPCPTDRTAPPLSYNVHPVAALFPTLPADELAQLAEDITANGLLEPIVLDRDGVLIDGRNRRKACERAGVEPTFTTLEDGQDPVDFIFGKNVRRRHLDAGQRAMAAVMAAEYSPRITQVVRARIAEASQSQISKANVVLGGS